MYLTRRGLVFNFSLKHLVKVIQTNYVSHIFSKFVSIYCDKVALHGKTATVLAILNIFRFVVPNCAVLVALLKFSVEKTGAVEAT